ncbi:MAG TPA: phage holin family protein [Tepidisphaeraceae bacterium]|nr:phage holin family protein [Tepidisphaeraceae bacterium]
MVADGNKPGFSGYAAERETAAAEDDDPTPASAFGEMGERISEMRDYAAYYVKARVDKIKAALRNILVMAALGIVGLIAGGALVVTAVVLLCTGIAQGLTALFGGHAWAGNLVTAVLLLGMIGIVAYVALTKITKTSKERMVHAYEQLKREQRADHGTDVHERAEEQRAGV